VEGGGHRRYCLTTGGKIESEGKKQENSYPFKKPGEISEVCVEQENALDSNFGNFLPQNIEMIRKFLESWLVRYDERRMEYNPISLRSDHVPVSMFDLSRKIPQPNPCGTASGKPTCRSDGRSGDVKLSVPAL
jgi:hypothetical protein